MLTLVVPPVVLPGLGEGLSEGVEPLHLRRYVHVVCRGGNGESTERRVSQCEVNVQVVKWWMIRALHVKERVWCGSGAKTCDEVPTQRAPHSPHVDQMCQQRSDIFMHNNARNRPEMELTHVVHLQKNSHSPSTCTSDVSQFWSVRVNHFAFRNKAACTRASTWPKTIMEFETQRTAVQKQRCSEKSEQISTFPTNVKRYIIVTTATTNSGKSTTSPEKLHVVNMVISGVSGPDHDRTISLTSLCGPKISGPDNDVVVWS